MFAADLAARVRRLDQHSRLLALEISIVTKADDPMLYLERRAYLDALHATARGVDRPVLMVPVPQSAHFPASA